MSMWPRLGPYCVSNSLHASATEQMETCTLVCECVLLYAASFAYTGRTALLFLSAEAIVKEWPRLGTLLTHWYIKLGWKCFIVMYVFFLCQTFRIVGKRMLKSSVKQNKTTKMNTAHWNCHLLLFLHVFLLSLLPFQEVRQQRLSVGPSDQPAQSALFPSRPLFPGSPLARRSQRLQRQMSPTQHRTSAVANFDAALATAHFARTIGQSQTTARDLWRGILCEDFGQRYRQEGIAEADSEIVFAFAQLAQKWHRSDGIERESPGGAAFGMAHQNRVGCGGREKERYEQEQGIAQMSCNCAVYIDFIYLFTVSMICFEILRFGDSLATLILAS